MITEELWNIPASWEWTKLSRLGDIVGGGTPSTKEQTYWGDDVSWISPADLTGFTSKTIARGTKGLTRAGLDHSSAKVMPRGSVHFSSRAPIGYVAISSAPLATNQGFKSLVPAVGIFNEFVYYYLKSATDLARKRASGTTFRELSGTAFGALPIPIAPTHEQRRIVSKLEELFSELDKGIESLTTAREQLKAYRQSVLKHAFEGRLTEEWRNASPHTPENLLANVQAERKTRNPKKDTRLRPEKHDISLDPQVPNGWSIEFLGNLNVDIFDGPFGSHLKTSDYVESGVRVIRLENIGQGHFIDKKQSFVSKEKYTGIQKHTVVPGDIVFSSFVTEAIRSALVPSHISFAVNKADCFAIRFFGKTVNPKFVQLFLRSRNPFKQVEGMIHGVGRPRINTSQLKEIVVPICAPAEQVLIIERLEALFSETDALESTLETGLAQLAAMRQSILKQAFSGQLVAQDPKDESASVLLEHIRAEREGTSTNESRNSKNGKSRKKNAA
jgi:type I restriction enzyme S subunit